MSRVEEGTVLVDRFEIKSLVERGGMGAIDLAIDRSSGDPVALKLMDPSSDPAEQATTIERLLREARTSRGSAALASRRHRPRPDQRGAALSGDAMDRRRASGENVTPTKPISKERTA